MALTTAPPELETGGPPRPAPPSGGGDGGEGGRGRPAGQTARLGMGLALASISMLFVGLTSAYIVRRGVEGVWQSNALPALLYLNTAVLLASSFLLERARRQIGTGNRRAFRRWLSWTLLAGAVFLAGQLAAWRQLAAAGVYLSSNPHASFFYVLTALHGLHLFGGLLALAYLRVVAAGGVEPASWGPARLWRWTDATALYWHFMDGLWIYLLVLLSLGR
jgi:cytochrome c oxidase subunit 3